MLFNSRQFLIFFALVYPAYLLLLRRHRLQNAWLLLASVVFYAFYDWRFVGLLALSSGIDFLAALGIARSTDPRRRRALLVLSIASNLTILAIFKYANFFVENAVHALELFGVHAAEPALSFALPIGISFYTFQAISYVIDVYRGAIPVCRDPLAYALFIAYFPHLVAGPIQHPNVLLPQVLRPRQIEWSQVQAGLLLIITGYVQKVALADNLAGVSNRVFDGYIGYSGLDLVLGAIAFTFQIYCDFAGYSNIARGLSKLMGFELMQNFCHPYFAVNPSEFWQRWHISLSTWLRNYLYVPLGGNRGSKLRTARNLMITMLLGGLWHGAAWNFVLWGAYHGVLLVAYRWFGQRGSGGRTALGHALGVACMFALTVYGWVLFRCESLEQIRHISSELGLSSSAETGAFSSVVVACAAPLVLYELLQRRYGNQLFLTRLHPMPLGLCYGFLLVVLLVFGVREQHEFIYFQF
jgi:alginate O-acetyltransferase complex protein AlgI